MSTLSMCNNLCVDWDNHSEKGNPTLSNWLTRSGHMGSEISSNQIRQATCQNETSSWKIDYLHIMSSFISTNFSTNLSNAFPIMRKNTPWKCVKEDILIPILTKNVATVVFTCGHIVKKKWLFKPLHRFGAVAYKLVGMLGWYGMVWYGWRCIAAGFTTLMTEK